MSENNSWVSRQMRIIPKPAKIIAWIAFVGLLAVIWVPNKHWDPTPPATVRTLILIFAAFVGAFIVLFVGYINGDARRRGMSALFWTLLVIFVPNLVGLILYFLMRKPLPVICPQCSASLKTEFNYCPKCNFRLTPTCSACQRSIHLEDAYCPYCGRAVAGDSAPIRAGA